jgi:hypothetical protein
MSALEEYLPQDEVETEYLCRSGPSPSKARRRSFAMPQKDLIPKVPDFSNQEATLRAMYDALVLQASALQDTATAIKSMADSVPNEEVDALKTEVAVLKSQWAMAKWVFGGLATAIVALGAEVLSRLIQ